MLAETKPMTTKEGKDWLISHLKYGPVTVTFLKKDGTERVLNCTLKEGTVPQYEKKTDRVKAKSEETLSVWDLDKNEWRSFRWDSILTVTFNLE